MANKDPNGGKKHNKKNNLKDKKNYNPYSQKCVRIKEQLVQNTLDKKGIPGVL